MDEISGKT
jgi:hypothetical protein